MVVVVDVEEDEDGDDPGAEDGGDGDPVRLTTDQAAAQQQVDGKGGEWQQRDQVEVAIH
jgi:hypothetical protein